MKFVEASGDEGECDFCSSPDSQAVGLRDLFVEMHECIRHEYMPASISDDIPGPEWELDPTSLSSTELLSEFDDPLGEGELAETFCRAFDDDWILVGAMFGTHEDHLRWGWEGFVETVKSSSRSVFLHPAAGRTHEITEINTADMLDRLAQVIKNCGALILFPKGQPILRGRKHHPDAVLKSKDDLGAPPAGITPGQRMNPPGIPFFYGAHGERTALAELRGLDGEVATVASWRTVRDSYIVDLAEIDPGLTSLADLDRQQHIEPYLNSVAKAINSKNGEPITTADQERRILTASSFLSDVTEWGWADVPNRRLIFRSDIPRLPKPLPRYLPVDADRRLGEALAHSDFRLAADALLLARACGLRIGELLDLELDCVHEVPGNGAWLKVPLGKLDTERMVPLDEETVALVDRIAATRSEGRPLPHPRYGRSAQFLFTHHGRRLGQNALRMELSRAGETAGIGHVTPHQLRHTFATAMVNAGVSLQALMALLGHVSAAMSLRYGRLFDTTVRAEYERALDLAKARIGPLPTERLRIPVTGDGDWRDAPAIKARLGGGYCLRAPAQGSCPYANICEHCPNFHTDAASISVLSAQRIDAEALAADAESRGWIEEADRHRRLITRLDTLLAENVEG